MDRTLAALLFLALAAPSARAQEASFSGLGFLPGQGSSTAWGVSADGNVVVGQSGGWGPYRWEDGVMEDLGGFANIAFGVSADGRVAVGEGAAVNYPPDFEAFRWEDGALTRLGFLPGHYDSIAWDVSADGAVVVGVSQNGGLSSRPFRWEAGVMTALPLLPGANHGTAYGVSADGRVVVGTGGGTMRWVDGVAAPLPGPVFAPFDVSADGSAVVGIAGGRGYLWREGIGTVELPMPPGAAAPMQAHAVSGDGRLVAGPTFSGAFVWTEETGSRLLKEVLEEDYGLDLTGWSLDIVWYNGVNYDGTVIVGEGTNPSGQTEGWRAVLPRFPVGSEPEAPGSALALSVAPNPARGASTVRLVLPVPGRVCVAAFDVLGRVAAVLHDGPLAAGAHRFALDASRLAPGLYVVRAEGPGVRTSRTLTVVR